MHYTYAIAAWVGVCIASIPYSRRARHPQLPALTAWLTFTTVFSVLVIVTFLTVAMLADAAGLGDARSHPAAAVAYLSLLVGPALYFADLWIRRPPRRVPRT